MLFIMFVVIISVITTLILCYRIYGLEDIGSALVIVSIISGFIGIILWIILVVALDTAIFEAVEEETFQYEEISTDYEEDSVTVLLSKDTRNTGFTLEIPRENISKEIVDGKRYVKVTYYDVKDSFPIRLLKMGSDTQYREYEIHR